MKKWLFVFLGVLLFLSGCSTSISMDKEELHKILEHSSNGYAEIILDSQTKDESYDYFDEKVTKLVKEIKENNESINESDDDNKKLKKEIIKYNKLVITSLKDFLNGETNDESLLAGEKLGSITDKYFDGEIPSKTQELLDYFDSSNSETSESSSSYSYDTSSSTSDSSEISDITQLSETPTTGQMAILADLAQQQFDQEYPYKGSKIHTLLGVIQNWTIVDNTWFYKAEATIVNGYGAEMETTIEIYITPTGADSGEISITQY